MELIFVHNVNERISFFRVEIHRVANMNILSAPEESHRGVQQYQHFDVAKDTGTSDMSNGTI